MYPTCPSGARPQSPRERLLRHRPATQPPPGAQQQQQQHQSSSSTACTRAHSEPSEQSGLDCVAPPGRGIYMPIISRHSPRRALPRPRSGASGASALAAAPLTPPGRQPQGQPARGNPGGAGRALETEATARVASSKADRMLHPLPSTSSSYLMRLKDSARHSVGADAPDSEGIKQIVVVGGIHGGMRRCSGRQSKSRRATVHCAEPC